MKKYQVVMGCFLSCALVNSVQAVGVSAEIKQHRAPASVADSKPHDFPLPTVLAPQNKPRNVLPFNELLSDKSLPQALHYLGDGSDARNGKRAEGKLAQQSPAREDVSEPASEVLLLVALSALAIAVRRQAPS